MRVFATLICVFVTALSPALSAPMRTIEAQEAFEARQQDLVSLAGKLGILHRLHQICGSGSRPDLYRSRMQQVVKMEAPIGSTRLDMIAVFNSSYREMSRIHLACGEDSRSEYEMQARQTLQIVERLYAPFR